MLTPNKTYNYDAFDGIKKLSDNSVDCVVTSPPYWALRSYEAKNEIGLEPTPEAYIEKLVSVFVNMKPKLKDTATIFVNIADTYSGSGGWDTMKDHWKPTKESIHRSKNIVYSSLRKTRVPKKSMVGIPQRFSLAMIDNGFILRNTIIWRKPNAKPESVKDRFTNDYEYLYFFTLNGNYYFEQQFEPLKESSLVRAQSTAKSAKAASGKYNGLTPEKTNKIYAKIRSGEITGRNMRAVWDIATQAVSDAHFAVFPEKLIETPIIAGCPKNGLVLDPFMGRGTTALVALKNNRNFIGFDSNKSHVEMAERNVKQSGLNGIPEMFREAQKQRKMRLLIKELDLLK